MSPWLINGTGRGPNVAQIGNYHLSQQYGGVTLHRMHNEFGGVTAPLGYTGNMTKRAMYDCLHAYINGFTDSRMAYGPLRRY
jgi:hypothetical protein